MKDYTIKFLNIDIINEILKANQKLLKKKNYYKLTKKDSII